MRSVVLSSIILICVNSAFAGSSKYTLKITDKNQLELLLANSYPEEVFKVLLDRTRNLDAKNITLKKTSNMYSIALGSQLLQFSMAKEHDQFLVRVNGRIVKVTLNNLLLFTKNIRAALPNYTASNSIQLFKPAYADGDITKETLSYLIFPLVKPEIANDISNQTPFRLKTCQKNPAALLHFLPDVEYLSQSMNCSQKSIKVKIPADSEGALEAKMRAWASKIDQMYIEWGKKNVGSPNALLRWASEKSQALDKFLREAEANRKNPKSEDKAKRLVGLDWLNEHAQEYDNFLSEKWKHYLRNSGSDKAGTKPLLEAKAESVDLFMFRWAKIRANELQYKLNDIRKQTLASAQRQKTCEPTRSLLACLKRSHGNPKFSKSPLGTK